MADLTFEMDFVRDVAAILRERLGKAAFPDVPGEADEELIRRYLNVLHRRVPIALRRTHFAREFQCPPEHRAGLDQLIRTSETGGDLKPYQSTRLDQPSFNDGMVNDFGLQHFHLGLGPYPKNPMYKDRTGLLLYALVANDGLYCISVLPHKNWSRQELLDITHANWPDILDVYKFREPSDGSLKIAGLTQHYTDEDIEDKHRHGINVVTQRSDGSIHFPPGGGVTAAKGINSARVSRATDQVILTCEQLEREVKRRRRGSITERSSPLT
jgi:hypothetical protein